MCQNLSAARVAFSLADPLVCTPFVQPSRRQLPHRAFRVRRAHKKERGVHDVTRVVGMSPVCRRQGRQKGEGVQGFYVYIIRNWSPVSMPPSRTLGFMLIAICRKVNIICHNVLLLLSSIYVRCSTLLVRNFRCPLFRAPLIVS